MHAQRQSASGLNAYTLKIPIPSAFNILEGRSRLRDYPDTKLCDFLQFGWPVGFTAPHLPLSSCQNHGSALSSPQIIDSFLDTECHLGTTCGPFKSNPFYTDMVIGPLQITHSRSGKPCIVLYLSFPHGSSVNSGIPSDTYLDKPFTLRLPSIDAPIHIIRLKGTGCHLFKKDLSWAYRQLRIDPRDFHLLGYCHQGYLYFDLAPPFGLCSSAMMCQQTTNAVTYKFRALRYSCTNYIDNFGGAETPDKSTTAFNAFGDLFSSLGLQSSPDKDCPLTTSMVFLGIHLDTLTMSMSVTPERLEWPLAIRTVVTLYP